MVTIDATAANGWQSFIAGDSTVGDAWRRVFSTTNSAAIAVWRIVVAVCRIATDDTVDDGWRRRAATINTTATAKPTLVCRIVTDGTVGDSWRGVQRAKNTTATAASG